MPKLPAIPKRTSMELSRMRVHRRLWERFKPAWWAWVLIPFVAALLLGVVEWWKEGHNAKAWHHVRGDYVSYLIVFGAISLALILWHFLRARRDVFVAHRDRGDKAEQKCADAEADRDKCAAERDKAAAERDEASARAEDAEGKIKPHIGQYVDKLIEVKLPEDAAAAEAAARGLGLRNTRFTAETALPERPDIQLPAGGEPQAGDPQTDDQSGHVREP